MHDQVETIYQTILYIENHLGEEITVGQIADAAGYSVFHFIRTFNQIVHLTPCDYLMRRRLTEAARRLVDSNWRIIDIAQDFCFNSQEGFTRVFKKMFRITPGQVRNSKRVPIHDQMPARTMEDLYYVNSARFQPPKLEKEESISLKGLMTALDADEEVQRKQRERLRKDLCSLPELRAVARVYEFFSSSDPYWENQYFFVGVDDRDLLMESASLVSRSITAGSYVRINAAEEDRVLALRYVYSTWMPKTGLTALGRMEIVRQDEDLNFRSILIPVEEVVD